MVKVYVAVILLISVYLHCADAQDCKCGMTLGRFCGSRRDVSTYLSGSGCDENALYECRFQGSVPVLIAKCPHQACLRNVPDGTDVCLVTDCKCGAELGRICGTRRNVKVNGTEPYLSGKGCLENAVYECRVRHGHPVLIADCPTEACQQNEVAAHDVCLLK
ncbi:unnamed protein product [Oppiella nova]|uniref:Uncharacterized protein n=1 Tax=Oppiella nova TaxID=334625 RepID=A0A7R9QUG2_9ACAR|nr:unnamed protein product [Oppiella nova]CAG2175987.1 unnamed protein product [Oppiella nova]